ncbi:hypothetical protein AGOR_G00122590 [Albula goreensis]|uniref:Interleukin n=1 Tax=Albula goreensis TaxID=1534307 RepID=A0A8T3DED0_9TELE|nr:hypothetical protein AGOR_G00122590 [Albula goreensis]
MSEGRRTKTSSCRLSAALSLLYLVVMPTVGAGIPIRCSHDLIGLVQYIMDKDKDMNSIEERLYTPEITDFEVFVVSLSLGQKCPYSTLNCFTKEMKVLMYHSTVEGIEVISKGLDHIPKQEDSVHCPQCEVHREKPVIAFLQTLKQIMQRMNAQSCR